MMYDIVPVDCWPWLLVAFFVGYTGQGGVEHLRGVLESVNETEETTTAETPESDPRGTGSSPGDTEPVRDGEMPPRGEQDT